MKKDGTASILVEFPREPQAESLKHALEFLGDVMRTLVTKEAGYGAIDKPKSVLVFAPDVTPEYRVRTRIDEKLSRLRELGTNGGDDEDTLLDLVGYLALLRGLQATKEPT